MNEQDNSLGPLTQYLALATAGQNQPPVEETAAALSGVDPETGGASGEYFPGAFVGPKGKGLPGYTMTGEKLDKGAFQKGVLKGMDKALFFAIVGDSLGAFGGERGRRGNTARVLQQLQAKRSAEQRRAELEEARAFETEQRKLDREEGRTRLDSDQEFKRELARLQNTYRLEQMSHNATLEKRALDLKSTSASVKAINDNLWRNASTVPGLMFEPHETPEATMDDPVIREGVRIKIARAHSENAHSLATANMKAKDKMEHDRTFAKVQSDVDMWKDGMGRLTEEEVRATGQGYPGQPIRRSFSPREAAAGALERVDVAMVDRMAADDEVLLEEGMEFADGALAEFKHNDQFAALYNLSFQERQHIEAVVRGEAMKAFYYAVKKRKIELDAQRMGVEEGLSLQGMQDLPETDATGPGAMPEYLESF